jgi:hypothetical protein
MSLVEIYLINRISAHVTFAQMLHDTPATIFLDVMVSPPHSRSPSPPPEVLERWSLLVDANGLTFSIIMVD